MRNAFTRLLTHLWIDVDLIQILLPNRIRVFTDLNKKNNKMNLIVENENDCKKYIPLKKFIRKYI